MAIITCKSCGGDLILVEGQSVAECEYCGRLQTVPNADNEKKLNLFASANKLRAACEFDRAAGIYDAIKAEFPSEAEAYWGLVLCKYGIEYVDDPGTGKKVPTCHRLSYDSVMEDLNLELAMENADAVARKVYREEARQLEKIREGILAVSSNEKPYDIFICYKETDPNGDRTLDSVLAQDLYTALTDRGYRVFFSRITLQSKLGEAYEPYIFAALNSAKVMLAIGTDPEYYNAVWVKNEWSRYLKICAADKEKHLIPCYKDMDAYDMPREFRPLQGVDLGKMGAVQDILFNMEKYIPLKKQPVPVVQEKVVVGGSSGSNKIASLLDRGNMALEDGNWAKADSFFEDVLNNDSRNAQAYIGKTLALEKCRTMDALKRKRLESYPTPKVETLYIPERTSQVKEMVAQYSLPGYVEEATVHGLYEFERSYDSLVSGYQQQYREEELWWENHRQLSRAVKFASGPVAENLKAEKQHLFSQLADRVKKAQEADTRSVAKLEAAYDAHMAEADAKAEQLHADALSRREKDYDYWLSVAKAEEKIEQLKQAAGFFDRWETYKDSKNLAQHCRKRIADITAEQKRKDEERRAAEAVEAEKRRIAEAKAAAERKKRNTVIGIITGIVAVAAIAVFLVMTKVVIPGNQYKEAEALLAAGQYKEAITAFEALGDYQDSVERVLECAYAEAEALLASDDKSHAAMAFGRLGDYQDARQRSFELWDGIVERHTLSAKSYDTVALKEDGTIVATGLHKHANDWADIIAVSAGADHYVGLREDGSVVAVGNNFSGECDVTNWSDIVAVSAGWGHTVGLKSDGTVVATEYTGDYDYGQCDVEGWNDIIAVSAGYHYTVGLRSDGTVVSTEYTGKYDYGQCNVESWTDIVAISSGKDHTVGLKTDGTVVATKYTGPFNDDGRSDVAAWKDIIAIQAGDDFTLGLKMNGTVLAAGREGDDGCKVAEWTDIVAISAGTSHSVGLKSDGTVVATEFTGKNYYGQCDTKYWSNIRMPDTNENQQILLDIANEHREQDYAAALVLMEAGDYENAYSAFLELGEYKDAAKQAENVWNSDWDHGKFLLQKINEKNRISVQDAYDLVHDFDSTDENFMRLKEDLEKLLACDGRFTQLGNYGKYYADITFYISAGNIMMQINYTNYDGSIFDGQVLHAEDNSEYWWIVNTVGEHTSSDKTYNPQFTIKLSPEEVKITMNYRSYTLIR